MGNLVWWFLSFVTLLIVFSVAFGKKPRIVKGTPNMDCAAPPEPPRIDRNVRFLTPDEHIGIVNQILPGNMLDHVKASSERHAINEDGRLVVTPKV